MEEATPTDGGAQADGGTQADGGGAKGDGGAKVCVAPARSGLVQIKVEATVAATPTDSGAQDVGDARADGGTEVCVAPARSGLVQVKVEATAAAGGSEAAASSSPKPNPVHTAVDRPVPRLEANEAPVHGLESTKFCTEIHHGGFFVGSGVNVSYLDGKIAWFDYLDRCYFNNGVLDYLIQTLGYSANEMVEVMWCPPGKSINELLKITLTCKVMAAASIRSKVLVVFLDHVDRVRVEQKVEDDVCYDGCPELPEVLLSPNCKKAEEDSSINSEHSEIEAFDDDLEGDPTWNDSDYDFREDDTLYEENVDDSEEDGMVERGKKFAAKHAYLPGSDEVKEGDLELPAEDDSEKRHKSDSDDEEYKKKKKKKQKPYKYKPFNSAGDMEDPQFKLSMVFESVEQLRTAVSQYSVTNQVQIRKTRNNKKRYEAHCCEGCPWKLVAVKDSRTVSFLVKTMVSVHTCEKVEHVKELTTPFLAKQYVEMFRDNDRMTLKTFARKV